MSYSAIPFSRGSSGPRDRTQVSCIAGRFFTVWATREALLPPKWAQSIRKLYNTQKQMNYLQISIWDVKNVLNKKLMN